jgi:hypothetical protein
MVGAPESRRVPTKIIIVFALHRERVTLSPEASCSIPAATWQVRKAWEGPPGKTGYSSLDLQQQFHQCCCSAAPVPSRIRQPQRYLTAHRAG